MSTKVTFSLNEDTVARLRTLAERLRKPQSQVVREAITDYAARADRLGDRERLAMLSTFDRLVPTLPGRATRAVDAELRDVHAARRHGGRRGGAR